MTLKHRIAALERSNADIPTVFASVPVIWTQARAAKAVRAQAIADGIAPPFHTFPVQKADAHEVIIDGIESMQNLLEHVALYGRSLGQTEVRGDTNSSNKMHCIC